MRKFAMAVVVSVLMVAFGGCWGLQFFERGLRESECAFNVPFAGLAKIHELKPDEVFQSEELEGGRLTVAQLTHVAAGERSESDPGVSAAGEKKSIAVADSTMGLPFSGRVFWISFEQQQSDQEFEAQ